MTSSESLQAAIKDSIHEDISDSKPDVETISKLIGLFSAGDLKYSKEQLELFDDVFESILDGLEEAALEVLSRYIAATTQVPPKLLKRFALDISAPVAGPVLQSCPSIPTDVLVEVAENRCDGHLQFLSRRKELPPQVTTPLVIRGSEKVLSEVIDNETAQFSSEGLETLVERSAMVDDLAEKLAERKDIPHQTVMQLLGLASNRIKEKFKAQYPAVKTAIDVVVDGVADKTLTKTFMVQHDFHAARKRVFHIQKSNRISKADFGYLAKHKDIEGAIVVLGELSNQPLELIARMLHDADHLSIVALLRAVDLPWLMVKDFLTLRATEISLKIDVDKFEQVFNKLDQTLAWSIVDAKSYVQSRR